MVALSVSGLMAGVFKPLRYGHVNIVSLFRLCGLCA